MDRSGRGLRRFGAGVLQRRIEDVVAGGEQFIDIVLGNATAVALRTVQEMGIRAVVDRAGGVVGFQFLDAPDVDHQVDAAFQVAQHLHDLVGALAGQVLERAGHEDLGRLRVDVVTGGIVGTVLAQHPGLFLDLLGGLQNGLGRPFRLGDDSIKLVGSVDEPVAVVAFLLDIGDLGFRAFDRLVHVGNVETDLVEIRHLALPGDHLLKPLDRTQYLGRLGCLVAIEKLF